MLAANDFRNMLPRFNGDAQAADQSMVDGLGRFAANKGMTNARVAIGWLLCKHPHVVPIPDTRRITYLVQNAAASGLALSAPEMADLDALFPPEAGRGWALPRGWDGWD